MKLRALLFLVLIVFNAKAQEINFLSENFNNISSWCQNGEKFINTEENYIAHNSEVAGNDTIFKELKDFYPEKGNTTWKISFCALFSTTTANNFQFVLIANQKNYDENFYGIGVQIGKNNTLNLIKYNGKKQETVFSLFLDCLVRRDLLYAASRHLASGPGWRVTPSSALWLHRSLLQL